MSWKGSVAQDSVFNATESVPEIDLGEQEKIDDFLFTSPFTSTTFYKKK